jgi:hypothetical protein
MSKYLVLTPWNGLDEDLLELCKESVEKASDDLDVEHRVIRCGPDWEEVIFEMRNDAEFVAYVDADDIVYNTAIKDTFLALERSTAGLAFTKEQLIDRSGQFIIHRPYARVVQDILSQPSMCHHLAAMRRGSIDEEPLRVYRKYANFSEKNRGCPLDWLMRARAAITHGFVFVDQVGYGYRQNKNGITADPKFFLHLSRILPDVRAEMYSWQK